MQPLRCRGPCHHGIRMSPNEDTRRAVKEKAVACSETFVAVVVTAAFVAFLDTLQATRRELGRCHERYHIMLTSSVPEFSAALIASLFLLQTFEVMDSNKFQLHEATREGRGELVPCLCSAVYSHYPVDQVVEWLLNVSCAPPRDLRFPAILR
jgi:hypothetical protein